MQRLTSPVTLQVSRKSNVRTSDQHRLQLLFSFLVSSTPADFIPTNSAKEVTTGSMKQKSVPASLPGALIALRTELCLSIAG